MCIIDICMQCLERYFEVLSGDVEDTELTIEELVSKVLLDLFGDVIIHMVTVSFSSDKQTKEQFCAIRVRAEYPGASPVLVPQRLARMELAIEDNVSCLLLQLFETVIVENVIISLGANNDDLDLPLSA